MLQLIAVVFSLLIFGIFAVKKNALTKNGALVAFIFGFFSFFFGSFAEFIALVLFFVLGEIATKVGRKRKGAHEIRNEANVIANGFAAILFLGLKIKVGFYAAIACALSDTLSSEIGMLSKEKPILITNPRKKVKPGTDGGITILGTFFGLMGAFLIAFTNFFFYANIREMLIIGLSGFLGCIIDSILGAKFERKKILNNSQVNLIATVSSSFIALFAKILI